jgi:hypothetical protein
MAWEAPAVRVLLRIGGPNAILFAVSGIVIFALQSKSLWRITQIGIEILE